MLVLAIETTGKNGSAALIDESNDPVMALSTGEMSHLTDIIELIDLCFQKAGRSKADLTHVAASVGPGSFTGIRIGVSVARALGQSLNLPCIAVPTLEAMMLGALDFLVTEGELRPVTHICTIINARRHQTYGAIWSVLTDYEHLDGNGEPGFLIRETVPQGQHMIEEIMEAIAGLQGTVVMTGDGVDAYRSLIADAVGRMQAEASVLPQSCGGFKPMGCSDRYPEVVEMPAEARYQRADAVARIAIGKAAAGDTVVYDKLLPDYMRKTEAEMKLEAGTLSNKIREAR